MSSKLYVGNISLETGEQELRDAFTPYGTITEVYIASDRFTGRPRGFAFVTFSTDDEAKVAVEKMSGVTIGGNVITVNEARPQPGTTVANGRTFTSPNRKPGAFHARGKRRY
ncbi:MAG: RNA recognition motif domain-containing protein [Candidatus Acidiferrales bacterium]